jgi:hypothetical protein
LEPSPRRRSRPYLWLSFMTPIILFVSVYSVMLVSYSRNEAPLFAPILIVYGFSMFLPFLLSFYTRRTKVLTGDDVLDSSRGTAIGTFVPVGLALLILFAENSFNLLLDHSPIIGIPLIFTGSTLLSYLASARIFAMKIIDPKTRQSVMSRLTLPVESFAVLVLSIMSGRALPRRLVLRTLNWVFVMLVFPLTLGWLLVVRDIGPALWLFPPIYYGLLFTLARRDLSLLGAERIAELRDSLHNAPASPGPTTASEVIWMGFIGAFYVYLLVQIIIHPLY